MRLTVKRLLKPRSILRILFVLFLVYVSYILGLFTHFFERNLSELNIPVKIDIKIALESFYRDINTTKYLEQDDFKFSFIHTADQTCKSPSQSDNEQNQPFLVILVKSKITHFERREVIRKTWGQSDSRRKIRTVFLTGLPSPLEQDEITRSNSFQIDLEGLHHNSDIIHSKKKSPQFKNHLNVKNAKILDKLKHEDTLYQLELEYEKYQDIVQQNFYDAYYNNTIKTVMGIKWIVEYCPNAKFYLFIDDDFYLNPSQLMKFLSQDFSESTLANFYTGFVYNNSSPMRHMMSKWYISLEDYPYHKFPPYVSAGCYILSRESAKMFYIASLLIKKFKFDDIYMGILAYKLGIIPTHMSSVYYHAPSYYPSLYANDIIAAHGFEADELEKMWTQLEAFIKIE